MRKRCWREVLRKIWRAVLMVRFPKVMQAMRSLPHERMRRTMRRSLIRERLGIFRLILVEKILELRSPRLRKKWRRDASTTAGGTLRQAQGRLPALLRPIRRQRRGAEFRLRRGIRAPLFKFFIVS